MATIAEINLVYKNTDKSHWKVLKDHHLCNEFVEEMKIHAKKEYNCDLKQYISHKSNHKIRIDNAFVWNETKNKYEYWQNIYIKCKNNYK